MAPEPQQLTTVRRLTPEDTDLVARFMRELPEGDQTFLKEEASPEAVLRWCTDEHVHRWVAVGEDGAPQALLKIVPGALWSAHVGELRLVVGPGYRRRGLGRRLARHGLAEAVRLGLKKIVVEVVADKEGDIEMFEAIGFRPEALLADHILDRDGELHDLVLLSHGVDDVSASMDVLGLGDEVGLRIG
jgi:ribosomal protein S18 acetylase RimI-like enzyme